jgi:hypothetical protein
MSENHPPPSRFRERPGSGKSGVDCHRQTREAALDGFFLKTVFAELTGHRTRAHEQSSPLAGTRSHAN